MRITGGEWGGRTLKVPPSGVRPTQDRLRQAIFSSLGAAVAGSRVLDLFAGSGSMGLEALSRGAASACWVELDGKAHALLRENVRAVAGAEACARCIRTDALHLGGLARLGPFDFVFADPPYDLSEKKELLARLLADLAGGTVLRPGGWLTFEQHADRPPVEHPSWTLLRDRTMGGSRWMLYRLGAGDAGEAAAEV